MHLDVDLDELRAPHDRPKNIQIAEKAELRTVSLNFSLITTTTLGLDYKKRPIVMYFSYHYLENDVIIYDNVKVYDCLCLDRFYLFYYTA